MVSQPTEKFWICLDFTGKFCYETEQADLFTYSQCWEIKIELFNIVIHSTISNGVHSASWLQLRSYLIEK
jgi:hypothetical protein